MKTQTQFNIQSTDNRLDLQKYWNLFVSEEGNIYKQVTDFKLKYPSLKIFLAIGGWNEGTRKFQAISSSKASREEFAKNSLDFLR
jgi:chitinase